MILVFVCREIIIFVLKLFGFIWDREFEIGVVEGRSFWFVSRGYCCGCVFLVDGNFSKLYMGGNNFGD